MPGNTLLKTSVSNYLLNMFFARGDTNAIIPLSQACYIGMSTTIPEIDKNPESPTYGSIINFTEPAPSTGYRRSRLGINDNTATYIMDAAKEGSITNGENFIFFDEATPGGGGFGELKWFGLFSESTPGPNSKPVLVGELTTPVTVAAGNVLIFRPNNLKASWGVGTP